MTTLTVLTAFGTDDDGLPLRDKIEAGHGVDTIDATGTLTFTDTDTEHDTSGDLSADFDFLIAAASTRAVDTTDDSAILDANGNPTVTRKADDALDIVDFTANPAPTAVWRWKGCGGRSPSPRRQAHGPLPQRQCRGRGAGPGRVMFEEFAIRVRDDKGGVSTPNISGHHHRHE